MTGNKWIYEPLNKIQQGWAAVHDCDTTVTWAAWFSRVLWHICLVSIAMRIQLARHQFCWSFGEPLECTKSDHVMSSSIRFVLIIYHLTSFHINSNSCWLESSWLLYNIVWLEGIAFRLIDLPLDQSPESQASPTKTYWDGGGSNFQCLEYKGCSSGRRIMRCYYDGGHMDLPKNSTADEITLWFLLQYRLDHPWDPWRDTLDTLQVVWIRGWPQLAIAILVNFPACDLQ